jgi:hypothetical protein
MQDGLEEYLRVKSGQSRRVTAKPAKNERGKARKVNQPYEIWYAEDGMFDGPEIFQVLKCYQGPEGEANNQYARRLVAYAGSGEIDEAGHDIYLSELKQRARLVWDEANYNHPNIPDQYKIERNGRW